MIRRHWPVLETPPPKPDKWAQFTDEQLVDLIARHLGVEELGLLATRDELILWLESARRAKAAQ